MTSADIKRRRSFPDTYAGMYPGKNCRTVTFIVTHNCNLRCSYCYEHNKSSKRMSLNTAKRCVDLLFAADAQNGPYISKETFDGVILDFIGGEPLLEIGLIERTLDYFRERAVALGHRWAVKYMVSISTNGVLYDTPEVRRFLARNEGRVSMGITLDGDQKTHDGCRLDQNGCGSYAKAAAAFADARINYGQDGTKFTVAPENVHRLYMACRDMIERFDLSELHCNCVYEKGWTEELAGVLYAQLKALADWMIDSGRDRKTNLTVFDDYIGKPLPSAETHNWCGGTGKMLAFDVDGTVYPCLRYAPLSVGNRRPLRIGDVMHGIGVLPEDKATVDMLNAITRQSQSTEQCLACPIASGCGWCSAYNYEVTGTPDRRVTYICPTHKARVLATSYYWNRIYQLWGENRRFPVNVPYEWAVPIIGESEYTMLKRLENEIIQEVEA